MHRDEMTAIIAAAILMCMAPALLAQDGNQPASAEPLAQLSVKEIAGQAVSERTGAVIDLAYANERIEVKVGAHGIRDDEQVFVLVKTQDSATYQLFPAYKQADAGGDPIWLARDVRLPDEGAQRKRFLIRAAVGTSGTKTDPTDSLSGFTTVSTPPTPVAVLRWLPTSPALRIETIGGAPVESQSPVAVEASADVAGKGPTGNTHFYVITHIVNSAFWRVSAEAERKDDAWLCRDVRFIENGQPDSRYGDVFVIESVGSIPAGPIPARELLAKELSWSYSVRVVIRDEVAHPAVTPVDVDIRTWLSAVGSEPLAGTESLQAPTVTIGLEGSVTGLTQGKSIWCVLNRLGTEQWIIQDGPAILSGTKWTLPNIRLDAPEPGGTAFQLYVISADSALSPGIVDLQAWQHFTNGISRRLVVERRVSKGIMGQDYSLRVSRVGSLRIVAGGREAVQPAAGPVEVEAEIPDGYHVWVGYADAGSNDWQFVPAARNPDGNWETAPLHWSEAAGAKDQDVVAIATPGAAVVPSGHWDRWQPYAWVQSSYLTVVNTARGQRNMGNGLSKGGWYVFWLIIAILVVGATLGLFEWFWRLSSTTLDESSVYMSRVTGYLNTQVDSMGKINLVKSVLGLLLLGLGVFAIWGYFPIYQQVLRTALGLSLKEAHSLALLLIVFIALTGIAADVTHRYGRPKNSSIGGLFGYLLCLTLLLMFAAALLFFQGMLYREFYRTRTPDASILPVAFGAAAIFITGVELINFYWGSRLSVKALAWLVAHAIFLPMDMAEHGMRIVANAMRRLPSKADPPKGDEKQASHIHPEFPSPEGRDTVPGEL